MTGEIFINLTIDKINESIYQNGQKFIIKFLVHFEPGHTIIATGHFICYCKHNEYLWELNDIGMTEKSFLRIKHLTYTFLK